MRVRSAVHAGNTADRVIVNLDASNTSSQFLGSLSPPLITIVTASSTACIAAAWLITGCTTLHKGK